MAHGRSKEECDAILDAIEAEIGGIEDRATLYSSTEFKKVRLLYFTDDFKRLGARARRRVTRGAASALTRRAGRPSSTRRALQRPARRRQLARCARCARSAATRSSSTAAEGAELVDVDGNRYVDWVCSWGPLIHGHAHPAIVEAVDRRGRGAARRFGAPTEGEVELAEEVARRMPVGRDAADDLVGHRGVDERDPARPRGDRPRRSC